MFHSQLDQNDAGVGSGNVDRVLFKDLVEIVPLVQSLIDAKAKSSFTRRGSVTYTKTPSRECLSRKMVEQKGRNVPVPVKKASDPKEKDHCIASGDSQVANGESKKCLSTDLEMENEVVALREKVEDLQKKLLEKDDSSNKQLNTVTTKLNELNLQILQKDEIIKSTQHQLSDLKVKLADKTAALEKVQWELKSAKQKVEQLQGELTMTETNISSITSFFDDLTKKHSSSLNNYDDIFPIRESLPDLDKLDEARIQEMENAMEAYLHAVESAKERIDDEAITAAAQSRLELQSFLLPHSVGSMT